MLSALLVLLGFFAGMLGSLTGIGGGILLLPILALHFGILIRQAIGTSLVAVITTSAASSSALLATPVVRVAVAGVLFLPRKRLEVRCNFVWSAGHSIAERRVRDRGTLMLASVPLQAVIPSEARDLGLSVRRHLAGRRTKIPGCDRGTSVLAVP